MLIDIAEASIATRLDAITSVLVKGHTKLVAKFGDALLGDLAALALAALLGILLPTL